MHGLQPIAKIAPRPNDASQPPRELTTWPPIRSPTLGPAPPLPNAVEPVAVASDPRRRRRAVATSAGGRDAEQPGQVQPEHDQDDPADVRRAGR